MSDVIHFKDVNLVHNYLIGDKDAGRELYENAYAPLSFFIRSRYGGNPRSSVDYEEILAETMVRSVEHLDTYNGTCAFSTFLCGIAKNVIKEYSRKLGREIPTDFEVYNENDNEANSALTVYLSKYDILPEDYVIRKEDIMQTADALNQLKKQKSEYYEIIQLRVLNGTSYDMISKLSGESVSALESRFRRALTALKKILKK